MSMRIRTASEADAAELLAIYADYVEKTAVTFEYKTPSVGEFCTRIRRTLEQYPFFAAESDGQIVGYTYAGRFKARPAYDWSVETSIYVRMDKRRGGIGRALYGALETALQKQGVLNVNACIAYPRRTDDEFVTTDSVKFHEKLGYRMVGRFHECGYKYDRWYDMVWMEKFIGAHLEHQPPVKKFTEI